MSGKETFATAFNCMDGRAQAPVTTFIRAKTGVQFVDTVTEPGMEGYIAAGLSGAHDLSPLRRKLGISVNLHNSEGIVVAGHEECAGNPISQTEKEGQLVSAANVLKEMVKEEGKEIPVFAAYVSRSAKGLWIANEVPLQKPRTVIPLYNQGQ